jgi:hypothetical protein
MFMGGVQYPNVSGIAGDVLTLTSPTTAAWQAGGGGGSPFTELLNDVNVGYDTTVTGTNNVNLILGPNTAPAAVFRAFACGTTHDLSGLGSGGADNDNAILGGNGNIVAGTVFFPLINSCAVGGLSNQLSGAANSSTIGSRECFNEEGEQCIIAGSRSGACRWSWNSALLATLSSTIVAPTANGQVYQGAAIACESSNVRVIGGGIFGILRDSMVCAGNTLNIEMSIGNQIDRCFIAGGQTNTINESSGNTFNCAIIGGNTNTITVGSNNLILGGNSHTMAGGSDSVAIGGSTHMNTGSSCILTGTSTVCTHNNCFLFSDGSGALASAANNTFLALASGGTTFYSAGGLGSGVTLGAGLSAWAAVSDRNMKENFVELKYDDVLNKLDQIPIYQFNYIDDEAKKKNMGPVAQDWHAQFTDTGKDPLKIDTMDLDGVALASIKALKAQVQAQAQLIQQLSERLSALES